MNGQTSKQRQNQQPKIAIIGSYPPAYGGVSVHIERLHLSLLSDSIESHVYNVSSSVIGAENVLNMKSIFNWFKIMFIKKDIFHMHTTSKHWKILSFIYLISKVKNAKFIITYHSFRYKYDDFGFLSKKILQFIFNNTAQFIVTNSDIKKKLSEFGVNNNKFNLIPAFLPPINDESSCEILPCEITNFIKNHNPIISAYAHRTSNSPVKINGNLTTDIYGVDLLVDVCIIVKEKFPNIGFVLCITHSGNEKKLKEIKRKIQKNNLSENLLIYVKPIVGLYKLWPKSDIFVRPTMTDGDSIALREALMAKTICIASDSVKRPTGTIIFKNNDVTDFANKINDVLNNSSCYKASMEEIYIQNNFDETMCIYNKLWVKTN